IRTNQQVKAADRDQSNDFSAEESYSHSEPAYKETFDSALWTRNVRDWSRDFRAYPDLLSSSVQVSVQADNRYYVNSEGARIGHRIEGHRQKDEAEGQTFTKSVGEKILPEFLSVTFDPTLRKVGGVDLNGWYEYDDEGVPGKPVKAVENGILRSFLMSRSPVAG